MTHLSAGSATDIGRRQINQDRVLVGSDAQLFAVADGMGGHRKGEVAAEIAVTRLARGMTGHSTLEALLSAVDDANREVFRASVTSAELQGMGTTLTALALIQADGEDRLAVANVGDSRTYLLRNGELEQLTDDHSLVAEMVREGHLTSEGARNHRQRSVLTRALGVEPSVSPDVLEVLPSVGDRYLLCSDGLCGEVPDEQMAAVLRRLDDPDEAARELVRLALVAGGSDNISVIVVDVLDDDQAALRASRSVRTEAHSFDDPSAAGAIALSAPGGAPSPETAAAPAVRPRRPRLITWRVLLFVVALAVVGAIAALAIRNTPADQLPTASTTIVATTTTDDPFGPTTTGPTTIGVTGTLGVSATTSPASEQTVVPTTVGSPSSPPTT